MVEYANPFLSDYESRPLKLSTHSNLDPIGLFLGRGNGGLEVAVTKSDRKPGQQILQSAWRNRCNGRAVPLLLITLYGDHAAICGPSGDNPRTIYDLEPGLVERLCKSALAEPNRHAAARYLHTTVLEVNTQLPGIRNKGLFADQELDYGVPQRSDWQSAQSKGRVLLHKRHTDLLQGLGFEIDQTKNQTSILRVKKNKVAVALYLERDESCEVSSERFGGISPIAYALDKADHENLDYVFIDHDTSLRIYPTSLSAGTGRRGRTETFIEIDLAMLPEEKAAYLWLLFSGEAIVKGGTFENILKESEDHAVDLSKRLRERIYQDVVPPLAKAIVQARKIKKPTLELLDETYQMTLTVLFRLLFVAYAEDKELLPYRTNEKYRIRSLKQKARELTDLRQKDTLFASGASHWNEFRSLCEAIDRGHSEWGIPQYNGGLFSRDPEFSQIGAHLDALELSNADFGPILMNLLVDETTDGPGPIDFRSLGVREFGTIYEGLLESELALAETDLSTDKGGHYVPTKKGTPVVTQGEVYLHNASGKRKSSGSYYTKHFAVEYLLDHSLEPALSEHLQRLDTLDDREAGEAFFDFRVADIAMGSGHFLIASVDRIEKCLTSYLIKRKLPSVTEELLRLRNAVKEHLNKAGLPEDAVEIEDSLLLRRQIARRCIYGVDSNHTAVQLSRLSMWIHTFVPGLPLSFLNHNIVCGNSLVGIATFEELNDILDLSDGGLFAGTAQNLIGDVQNTIQDLARLSEASAKEIKKARRAYEIARRGISGTKRLFDIATAMRIPESGVNVTPEDLKEGNELFLADLHKRANSYMDAIQPFHFPIAFPEIFLRDRPGFDVIVGNPPWQEATLEEHAFWARHNPGLRAFPSHKREAEIARFKKERPDLVKSYQQQLQESELLRQTLVTGPYPGMGTGDPDVYKAFCWRFWHLLQRQGGRIGVVLPRSALCAKGSKSFREMLLNHCHVNATLLLNNKKWVFSEVHPQYTIGLVSFQKENKISKPEMRIRGPFRDLKSFEQGIKKQAVFFSNKEVLTWTDTAAVPLLPAEESAATFAQLRQSPRLDLDEQGQWRARGHRELDATNDKGLMDLSKKIPKGYWPVYKGASFDIWQNDTQVYYAWADPKSMCEHLHKKRMRASNNSRSPFFEFIHETKWLNNMNTLPCMKPRIAFRDVTNRTNQRTVIAALVSPRTFIANQAPYILCSSGDNKDQTFLLGILCSIPLDWYARRFVETHVNLHILNSFPIPRPQRDNPLWKRVVKLSGRLACPDQRYCEWAQSVGVDYGPLSDTQKDNMIAELDAVVAHLYGLSRRQLIHIFETFHENWDYQSRLTSVLKHFDRWGGKL